MRDFNIIQNKLMEEENMSPISSAILTADIMNDYVEEIRAQILNWAKGEDVLTFEMGGETVVDIMDSLNCSPLQALCVLNGYLKNPKTFATAMMREWKDRGF